MEYELDQECTRIAEDFMNMLLQVTPGLNETELFHKMNELLEPIGWSIVTAHVDPGKISYTRIVDFEDK